MKDKLILQKTLTLARRKGFKPKIYYVGISQKLYQRPTQSLLQRWLREKYNILVLPFPFLEEGIGGLFHLSSDDINFNSVWGYYIFADNKLALDDVDFKTYEEALEAGLKEGLNLIKV